LVLTLFVNPYSFTSNKLHLTVADYLYSDRWNKVFTCWRIIRIKRKERTVAV
jgi:hypothetical protein